jgi:hypothetical protein
MRAPVVASCSQPDTAFGYGHQTTSQATLEDFFGPAQRARAQPVHPSARAQRAIQGLLGQPIPEPPPPSPPKRRRAASATAEPTAPKRQRRPRSSQSQPQSQPQSQSQSQADRDGKDDGASMPNV